MAATVMKIPLFINRTMSIFITKVLIYVFTISDLLNKFSNCRSNYKENAENLLKNKII